VRGSAPLEILIDSKCCRDLVLNSANKRERRLNRRKRIPGIRTSLVLAVSNPSWSSSLGT
jgi:hypothetical protein